MDDKTLKAKRHLMQATTGLLGVLTLVSIAGFFLTAELAKTASDQGKRTETIEVTGKSERDVAPDLAEFTFTIREEEDTVTEAQEAANTKLNNIIKELDDLGIEKKDIKTTYTNISPVYEWYYENPSGLRCFADYCPPPYNRKQEIVGHEVSYSIQVKVREIDDAGKALSLVGNNEVSNLSGLSLTVEDREEIEKEVRDEALENARDEAKRIAKGLGVRLGDVVSYDEYGRGISFNTRSYYAEDAMMEMSVGAAKAEPTIAELPTGENTIRSTVTVVFEIK